MGAKHVSKRVSHKLKAKAEATAQSKTKIPRPIMSETKLLPVTPKGEKLDDHFGAEPDASPYGPQPTLIMKDAVSNFNGREEHHVLTEVLHTPIGYKDKCDITSFHDFEMCLRIQSCDFCTANPHCGWCEATGRCMPGGKEYAVCPTACINGWYFNRQSCENSNIDVYGMFMNTAPEASGFITPEMAEPKAYVRTVMNHPVVVHTPVVLGVNHEEHRVDKVNPFSGVTVSSDSFDKTTPITGEIQ